MAKKKLIRSGAPWETQVAYSRAVRSGRHVFVSGTAPVGEDGATVAPGDPYAQAKRCFEILAAALEAAGGTLDDVVRTRMFVTDISQWEAIGRAHREAFADVMPATSMVQVSALIDPDMLVEVEADAVVDDSQPPGS